jgi:hypothetical protein
MGDDPHLWLEDIAGEAALAAQRAHDGGDVG